MFGIREFSKCFCASGGREKDVSCSERISVSYRQRGWERMRLAPSGIGRDQGRSGQVQKFHV